MAVPILWRTKKQRYALQGEICPACERAVFPPRRICPYCGRDEEAAGQHEVAHGQAFTYAFSAVPSLAVRPGGDD
ncbi:zinc ribbon domain-containing protein [Litorilinea aerophila]|uniref:ChsH2 rubredoxin-like zinc ribbon domain-containing protein n=1 Tax=Litorilinea aerophila TaxID=1204385 RepID=A0A540VHT4_9CHLR|nr:zinc ribbon domain-containing protein [Litorilinea aerophila]MCC9075961.1 zinc ribbon domain-containing protein [Litorilinea aerophila]GIV78681.1 MAG: hypothetical protein KatS3mg050_3075 [Litorilinea sp.]